MNAIWFNSQRNSNVLHASMSKPNDSVDYSRRNSMANSVRKSVCVTWVNVLKIKYFPEYSLLTAIEQYRMPLVFDLTLIFISNMVFRYESIWNAIGWPHFKCIDAQRGGNSGFGPLLVSKPPESDPVWKSMEFRDLPRYEISKNRPSCLKDWHSNPI